jgi:hypothetical protein
MHKSWMQGHLGEYLHMEAPNIFESSVWNLIHVISLAPINSKVAPRFLENLWAPCLNY